MRSLVVLCIGNLCFLAACVWQVTDAAIPTETRSGTPVVASQESATAANISTMAAPSKTAVPAAIPFVETATSVALSTSTAAAASPTLTTVPSPTPSPDTKLEGPLLAFRMQDNERFYISIFDIGTGIVRDIKTELVNYPLELQWFDRGCLLFVRGRLIDLQGNIVWEIPRLVERGWVPWSFGDSRLSPDRQWLIEPHYSGAQMPDSAEFVDLTVVNLLSFSKPISLTKNGGAHASAAWSSSGEWVAFADYDSNGIAQLFRSSPDGALIEQLTFHTEPVLAIWSLAWSADDSQIAFAARENHADEADAVWLGLLNRATLETVQIQPEKLRSISKIWSSLDGARLVFTGEGRPELGKSDPLRGRRTHWVDIAAGTIINSFHEQQAPFGQLSIPHAVGDVDSIVFASRDGYYLLNGLDSSYEYLGDIQLDGLFFGVESSPFLFPGEEACTQE